MSIRTIGFRKINLDIPVAGTPVPISETTLFTSEFTVHVPSANSGTNVYIGNYTVDNTWIPRAKGNTFNFTHGEGDLEETLGFDLSKIYIDVDTGGDDVIIQYLAFDR